MAYPPLTALIPAYNAARTIERALDSVWRQGYPDLEVIVVDDGSSDDTAAIVERIKGKNLRLIRLATNRGAGGAMNAGIAEAHTEFIAFLDADDEWLDGKLQKQVRVLAAHPKMSFVSCGCQFVDPHGTIVATFGAEPPPYAPSEFWRGLLVRSYVAKPTVIARRSALLEVGGFDEQLKISEDQDMWIKLALAGEVGFVPEILIRVHETADSLMKRYGDREYEYGLPMIRAHLAKLESRLSRREIRRILAQRYSAAGRNVYCQGKAGRGATLVLQAMLMGNRPLGNLLYLATAAPPVIWCKQRVRAWIGAR
jgi:glycosyltransferase involved in cell wall biosynthesis